MVLRPRCYGQARIRSVRQEITRLDDDVAFGGFLRSVVFRHVFSVGFVHVPRKHTEGILKQFYDLRSVETRLRPFPAHSDNDVRSAGRIGIRWIYSEQTER